MKIAEDLNKLFSEAENNEVRAKIVELALSFARKHEYKNGLITLIFRDKSTLTFSRTSLDFHMNLLKKIS